MAYPGRLPAARRSVHRRARQDRQRARPGKRRFQRRRLPGRGSSYSSCRIELKHKEEGMDLIRIRNAEKHYQLEKAEMPALTGINLVVGSGERVCLMGPSGSGKSTLLNIIGCVDTLSAGTVEIAGRETGSLKDAQLSEFRNRTMGFVFQTFNLIPVLS